MLTGTLPIPGPTGRKSHFVTWLQSFVKSILLTFVFMVIVDVVMYLKLERINMAESLKSVE